MSLPDPILYEPAKHSHLIPSLASIHIDCVTNDHTLASFLPPFSASEDGPDDRVTGYWQQKARDVATGLRAIVLQLAPVQNEYGHELVGCVILHMPSSETGPFRCVVEKLLVDSKYRKRGIARRLMGKLEEAAKEQGRGLVMLDTTIGSGAEHVYPKLGYKVVGDLPGYGISPETGRLVDERFFYKDLR